MSINNAIAKFLLGSNSVEELDQLHQWEKEEMDNINALNEFKEIYTDIGKLKGYQDFDSDQAWTKLNSNIEEGRTSTRSLGWTRWAVAASIMLVAGAAWFFNRGEMPVEDQFTSTDMIKSFSLEDNTSIVLDKNSKLFDISDFSLSRELSLLGRAHFDVTSEAGKTFIIHTSHGKIEVLGTRFSVLAEENLFEVIVEEGRVRVTKGMMRVELGANEKVILDQIRLVKLKAKSIDHMSWQKGSLQLVDASLRQLVEGLQRHYRVNIQLSDTVIANGCKINSVYKDSDLKIILEELKKIYGMDYSMDEGKVVIHQFKC